MSGSIKNIRILLSLVLIGCFALPAIAAVPELINYQGSLSVNQSGSPSVPDGDYPMTFRVYDGETGGTLLWQEDHIVSVVSGIYNVLLGDGTTTLGNLDPLLFSADMRWLELVIAGEVMSPRQRITSVAYSLQAETANHAITAGDAETVGGMSPADILPVGTALDCRGDDKVRGIDGSTGNVICADDVNTYNSAFDTEAEIDAAVANNNYSTGSHTVDTNASTICANGYFLNGDGSCDQVDTSGDCSGGRICGGGHIHSEYNSAASVTSGSLHVDRYDSYGELTDAGRLDNSSSTDILLRSQADIRYARTDITRGGTLHIDAAAMTPNSNAINYARINGGIRTVSPTLHWYGTGNVDVPNGATLTNMRVFFYDNDATNDASFSCKLYRRYLTDFGAALIAQVTYNTTGAINNVGSSATYDITSIYEVVSESSASYYVYASGISMENSPNLAHMGCRIQFTYQELSD